jgi:hypothetical protein
MTGSLAIDNPFVILMKLQEFHQQKNDRRRDPRRQISQEGKGDGGISSTLRRWINIQEVLWLI